MDSHRRRERRLDGVIWSVILAIAAIDLAVGLAGWFQIAWGSLIKPSFACGALALGGEFYHRVRRDDRLSAALTGTAQIVAFAEVAAPLSYIAASAALPLQDALLSRCDQALGLDWSGLFATVSAHPWLRLVMACAYGSFLPQTVGVVLALGFSGQTPRLKAFVIAFVTTSLVTIGLSSLLPAEGPWLFYGMVTTVAPDQLPMSQTSWPVFLGLRDGAFNILTGLGSEGIITFPSLHAALGVVFTCALWSVRSLRLPALALNSVMIAATPIEGSHYFADVIVGVAIAALCWIGCRRATAAAAPRSIHRVALTPSPALAPALPDVVTRRDADAAGRQQGIRAPTA